MRYFASFSLALSLLFGMPAAALAQETSAVLPQSHKAILQTVEQWAQAWRSQDIARYVGFYASDFVPENGLTLAQWRAQRQQRFFAADYVQIQIINPTITRLHGENALVVFEQKYRSSILQDQTQKTLQLVQEGGQWKIAREFTAVQR